ncbi:fatty acid desaturase family protein [Pseudomonas sp. UL073]|uniref:Fatty acid desaturase family protein n=1 Tax=Zestomonas insulae TaxID=2809017 RepID=A0ABS2I8I7_9GAMM|nr:fatty acid desaturase family protein [Pseudomonas insulae]MBM7059449.1 fatty acid desaturase family protein [Pseudomonas insulae]
MTSRQKVTDFFSREEIQQLTRRSDAAGWWAVLSTWAVIAATFAVLAIWPNPLTFVLALIVLGGRQLCLAILMHEAAHGTLFKTKALNDKLTDWLCARIVWVDVARYREHHLRHHGHTGTDLDPDWSLARPFPASRVSLARKFARDLLGFSGLKRLYGQLLMDIGVLKYTVASDVEVLPRNGRRWSDYARAGLRNMRGMLLSNAALAGILAACGQLWLYGVWLLAYLTTYSLFMRIRSLAEHACTERTRDMLLNTRTTRAGWLARATVAPIRVNFHIEHHLMAAVPYFRLPRAHRLLRERGLIDNPPGYLDVLRIVTQAPRPAMP